jgi:spermidine synthase
VECLAATGDVSRERSIPALPSGDGSSRDPITRLLCTRTFAQYPLPFVRTRPLLWMFFLSGCTSLVYEVVFHKLLGYVFGSSTLATTTVLVAFMGGLALGGRTFGSRADAVKRAIALYARLEFFIGLYALLVPTLLRLCSALYAWLGVSSDVHAFGHIAFRFALCCCILALPTVLMGGTLPLLAAAAMQPGSGGSSQPRPGAESSGAALARLYAVNTLGAAAGTLLGNYALLPYLGIYGALGLGAATNFFIAWRALRLQSRWNDALEPATAPTASRPPPSAAEQKQTAPSAYRLALPAAFAVGLVSFSLEIVWTHLLATIVGMSVYAFGLMLATFLTGLALGSALAPRLLALVRERFRLVWLVQFGLAAVVIGTLPLWDRLPLVFARAGLLRPSFAVMELTRAAVCVAMLLPPATLIGVSFPILLGTATFEPARIGARVGVLYALNTLGSIAGALASGLWLLELFGSRALLSAAAFASLLIGFAHAAVQPAGRPLRLAAASCMVIALVAVQARLPAWDWKTLAAGMNVNFSRGGLIYEVLWAKEDSQGGVTTITRERRGVTLRTNGKFQADDRTELAAQQGFALLPVLFAPSYGTALNIGYGSGITAGVLGRFPFTRIEVAELSPAIVEASDRYFGGLNFAASRDSRTRVTYNDGRNHLLVSSRVYDLITVEISSIWFAGAASLYSREFYESCRRHLNQAGVLQQWVQLHHITRRDLLILWNTLRSVFPYVSLWRQGTQGALIATLTPQQLQYEHIEAMNQEPGSAAVRARMPVADFFSLLGAQELDPAGMDAILSELPRYVPSWFPALGISRDAYPILEYSTPRGYALPDRVESENIAWLRGYRRQVHAAVSGVPDPRAARRIELLAAAGSKDCATLRRLGAAAPADALLVRDVVRECARGPSR